MRKQVSRQLCALSVLILTLTMVLQKTQALELPQRDLPFRFHSFAGSEHVIEFDAKFKMSKERAERLLNTANLETRNELFTRELKPVLPYLMGPGTHRNLGGPKKLESVVADWANVNFEDDYATIDYTYRAVWLLNKRVAIKGEFSLPVPYNENVLFTDGWKNCGDADPEHQTRSFFWYFWDPSRTGCEHKDGQEYQNIVVRVGLETINETETYPEYERLVREVDGKKVMTMTFAFGYANDTHEPNIETDQDIGVAQYRQFVTHVKRSLTSFTVRDIKQNEYLGGYNTDLVIGKEFAGRRGDIDYIVRVVVNADIDQMNLFAKSFAQDHDGFFAWFGHSRVGSGFDAENFGRIVRGNSDRFSITDKYQIIYWGGCNSYTYYTLPFFKFKSDLSPAADPLGTKNLDIISNGMPSYFTLNSPNAKVALTALLKYPEQKVSYQTMIQEIEQLSWRDAILTNVLGDEDNAKSLGSD